VELLIERIRRVLESGPPLRLAVLFGSHAKGSSRPTSDVDLAILPSDAELSLHHELELSARLTRELDREADVVRLDRAGTLVRWEVARHGVPVLCAPPFEWTRFQAGAASEHADIVEALRVAARTFQRRIARSPT